MTTTIEGGSKLKDFLNKLTKQKAKVDVGFFPEAKYSDGTQVAQVAFWQEFGTETMNGKNHIPPRPFLHPTYEEQKDKWMKVLQQSINQQRDEIDVKKALSSVGIVAQRDVQKKIKDWAKSGIPRNAPTTIEIKGFDSPLIHKNIMLDAVSYKVTT